MSEDLVLRAEAVAARAYAPYSGYHVGAVVRTTDGHEFEGVNVENAAYPLGCRQWLHEFRIPEVSFRRADGTIATYRAEELLPDTWDLPDDR